MRIRISHKIFSIAVMIVTLMCVGAVVTLSLVSQVSRELETITAYYLKLQRLGSAVQAHTLEYELHAERLISMRRAGGPAAGIRKELADMQGRSERLHAELRAAEKLFQEGLANAALDPVLAERLRVHLRYISEGFSSYEEHTRKTLAEARNPRSVRLAWMQSQLQETEDRLDRRLENYREGVSAAVQLAAERAAAHERTVLQASIALTMIALVLGLLVAAYVTKGIVRPVHDLVAGTSRVEDGHLELELPVRSRDEIGTLTLSFNHMVGELRLKERIKSTFGKYVDPRIVQELIDRDEGAGGTGERRSMTVFFSDIAGFTSISEALTPTALVTMINAYFTTMAGPIHENRGVIDKFIGDAVMAYWGPPFTRPEEQANLACEAALRQQELLEDFRARLPELLGLRDSFQDFGARMGLASGEVVVGEIGSEHSRGYTVMGDTVNTASRLEAINKRYGSRIMLAEGTRDLLDDRFIVRELDRIRVKGKEQPVAIFELVGRRSGDSDAARQMRAAFAAGLAAYRGQRWPEAVAAFEQAIAVTPDPAARVFLKRIEHFRTEPPGDAWDGVWTFQAK